MKVLIRALIFILLFIPPICYGVGGTGLAGTGIGGGGTAGTSYLLEQDFEGAGAPSGWSTAGGSGATDWDNTTSPLHGTQDVVLTQTADSATRYIQSSTWSYSGTIYGHFMFRQNTAWNQYATSMFVLYDVSNNNLFSIRVGTTGNINLYHGSVVQGGAAYASSLGTPYYIWWDYAPGSGANGVGHLYISATSTKPGSPTQTITNGNATTYATYLQSRTNYNTGSGSHQVDYILVDDADIGSAP